MTSRVINHGVIHHRVRDYLFSALAAYAFLGFFSGGLELFHQGGTRLISGASWKLAAGLAVVFLVFSLLKRELPKISLGIFVFALAVLLASDFTLRRFAFYSGDTVLFETLKYGMTLTALVLVFLFFFKRRISEIFSFTMLVLVQCIVAWLFLDFADSRLIFSDDHPSFLYRFALLKEYFPNIPFYNTDWNAGYSAREFYPSGMLNAFFLAFPLIYFVFDFSTIEGAASYTYLISYLYIFIVPWSVYLAGRILQFTKEECFFAGLLALGPSMGFFEWLLKYGTIGFTLSAGLTLLALASAIRLALDERAPKWFHVVFLLITSFLCISWSLSAFTFIPLVLYALFSFKKVFSPERRVKVISFAVLFVLLNALWVPTFLEESKVFSFLSLKSLPGSHTMSVDAVSSPKFVKDKRHKSGERSLKQKFSRSHRVLKQSLVKVNPLILLLFIPGLFLIKNERVRIALSLTICWLLLLALVGNAFKPQLELHRMVVVFSFLACLPVAVSLAVLLRKLSAGITLKAKSISVIELVVVLGALVLSPLNVATAYINKSDEHFIFAPKEFSELVEGIKEHGGSGRTFFLSFILQELGAADWRSQDGGHIAPLAMYSGKSMYAFGFYHNLWSTVDPIPESYRKRGEEGTEEFLDLVNATAVVTFKREWVKYCQEKPWYRQVQQSGRFRIFTRKRSSASYFLRGQGELEIRREGIRLIPQSEEMVIKFRYLPKLRSNYPEEVELFPVPAFSEETGGGRTEEVNFVGIRASRRLVDSGKSLDISYRPQDK